MSTHAVQSAVSERERGHVIAASGTGTRLEARRHSLHIALGVIWLVDAALQFQPFMFTRAFVTGALAPAASSSPWLLAQPIVWADHFMVHDIAWWNTLYALVQLLIAVGLFWRPTVRVALATSIVWSIAVWWFAEGFGGVFAGGSPLDGQPGAVLLYALLAVLLWPTGVDDAATVVDAGPWGRRGAIAAWIVLWVDFAVYFLVPANRAPQAMHDALSSMAAGEPGWVQSIDHGLATLVAGRGLAFSIGLALCSVVVAFAIVTPSLVRTALVVALVVAAFVWLAQDFGAIFTSQGTDINSGPLLALLAWSYWPLSSRRRPAGR